MEQDFIEFHNITRIFPGVKALNNVSFSIKKGEIHALVGENGAGKSTLINICSGVIQPNDGYIVIKGNKVKIDSPKDAEDYKIATVFQEVPICTNMTIAQNIFLGPRPKSKFGLLDNSFMDKETRTLLKIFNIKRNPSEQIGQLPLAEQSMIQILRAIYTKPDFLILDEPTSSLSIEQKNILFESLNKIRKERDMTVLYVSHRLEEIFEITSRISILKDGAYVGIVNTSDANIDMIIRMMVGRDIDKYAYKKSNLYGETIFEVNNLSHGKILKNISFNIKKGEILGLAGLQGAGRTELGRAIFGADKIDSGEIAIEGRKTHIRNVKQATKLGIAMISENRRDEGIIPILSVSDNLIIVALNKVARFGYFIDKRIRNLVKNYINKLNIKVSSPLQRIDSLSGGNQQKVIISRWLANEPKILICDEPTRGIDVGSKSEIHSIIINMARNGLSVLLISSELPELLSICDRILVMHNGRITGELSHEEATEEKIMYMATTL
ncbi:MAG: sugar ABC transporter ATP-binding protein [Actinobacteria bacterium]|nr:sugar ABC transporter ATP-binding protein [Actinomycetota bacterium]